MKQLGSTVTETIAAFRTNLGKKATDPKQDQLQAITRIVISLVVLGAGIYLVVTGKGEQGKAGMGLVGIVTGYWLK